MLISFTKTCLSARTSVSTSTSLGLISRWFSAVITVLSLMATIRIPLLTRRHESLVRAPHRKRASVPARGFYPAAACVHAGWRQAAHKMRSHHPVFGRAYRANVLQVTILINRYLQFGRPADIDVFRLNFVCLHPCMPACQTAGASLNRHGPRTHTPPPHAHSARLVCPTVRQITTTRPRAGPRPRRGCGRGMRHYYTRQLAVLPVQQRDLFASR